ncbi:hypothetical protein RSAG8_13101, partial [Rhizoctonia solani AG-8 WAC10335]
MSAVSTVATSVGLINRICVHRDEQVGVYGFLFYRDSGWVEVIIDDLLYTRIPKFEELWGEQKDLYHGDRERFDTRARVGGKTLFFARSKTENETWLPILEKAYARLHGDYQALEGDWDSEAIEGKRFVWVRYQWGQSECQWTGPWWGGSKEWTREWLKLLLDLHHEFGDHILNSGAAFTHFPRLCTPVIN